MLKKDNSCEYMKQGYTISIIALFPPKVEREKVATFSFFSLRIERHLFLQFLRLCLNNMRSGTGFGKTGNQNRVLFRPHIRSGWRACKNQLSLAMGSGGNELP